MADSASSESWMNVKQAADYLGVSEPTIFRWMREGAISFFKLGGSTRFKRENLDMVARKVTGKDEGEARAARCSVCGHSFRLGGEVRSTGKIYFMPEKTRFFVFSDSMVEVAARACPACGHIDMFADTDKLAKLMREADAEASKRADGEEDFDRD